MHPALLGCALLLSLPLASCIGPGLEPPNEGGGRSPGLNPGGLPQNPPAIPTAGVSGSGDFGNPVGPQPMRPDGEGPSPMSPGGSAGSTGAAGSSAGVVDGGIAMDPDDDAGVP